MSSDLLKNKTVLITGGSRGIGKAIAIEAAKEGALVIFTYHKNRKAAEETHKEIDNAGGRSIFIQLSLEDVNAIHLVINKLLDKYKIDILINNAAILFRAHFFDTKPENMDALFKTNLKAPFELSRLVAMNMSEHQTKGVIINISSDRDTTMTDGLSGYQVMKAGLNMMTSVLARTLSKSGIRVNTIAPGMVRTDMHRDLWQHNLTLWKKRENMIPLQRAAKPEEIASMVVFVASDKASYLTGSRILIDGGRTVGASNEDIPSFSRSSL